MRRGLLIGAMVLAWIHAASFLGAGPFDDDFICYRYARNWVEGHGLVFNVGERFEGFTVPLWVMAIAAGIRVGLDPVHVSLALSVIATGVAAYAVGAAWLRRFPGSRLPFPAFFVAAAPPIAWHGVTGLGTTVLAALLALWLLAWETARSDDRTPWAAGLWLALACLLRQECALFALPFFVVERRRGIVATLPLVALAGWTMFRLAYYGRWSPMTYHAKKLSLVADLGYGFRYIWQSSLECGVLVFALACPLARRGLSGRLRASTTAAVVGLLLHTGYVVYVGGDFMELARFFVPALPILAYVGAAGLRNVIPAGTPRVALAAAALVGLQWTQFGWTFHGRPYRFVDHDWFEARWEDLGRHFGEVVAPGTSVAISPIGAFGWYSGLPIVDILGLVNGSAIGVEPDLESVAMKGHHRFDADWVLAQRPALVILGNGRRPPGTDRPDVNPWERTVFEHPSFRAGYVWMVMEIPGGEPLDVFKRRDVATPPGARLR